MSKEEYFDKFLYTHKESMLFFMSAPFLKYSPPLPFMESRLGGEVVGNLFRLRFYMIIDSWKYFNIKIIPQQ